MELRNGSSTVAPLRNGRRQDPSYGSTGSVRVFSYLPSITLPDAHLPLDLVAGSGKSVLWYVSPDVIVLQWAHRGN